MNLGKTIDMPYIKDKMASENLKLWQEKKR